jgi:hypothetical protein
VGGSQDVWVPDWEAVLRLLDRWPWARLYPLHVHPDFSDVVLRDAQARAGEHSRANGGQLRLLRDGDSRRTQRPSALPEPAERACCVIARVSQPPHGVFYVGGQPATSALTVLAHSVPKSCAGPTGEPNCRS